MVSQKGGSQYENSLQNELNRATDSNFVVRCGYSGNSALPMPDIYVRTPHETHDCAYEVKRTSRDHIYVEYDDFDNLVKIKHRTPWELNIVLAYKFSQRELITHSVPCKSTDSTYDVIDRYVDVHSDLSRRSNDEKVRIDKPDLDSYESATAGLDDASVLANCF